MNIAEQLAELLPGVEISEEFIGKLTASIETAVASRVEEETTAIKAKAEEYGEYCQQQISEIEDKAEKYAEYVVENMTQKFDDYSEYVVEQFVEENRQKLVETEEYNRMAETLRHIKEAFEGHYFQLNAEPVSRKLAKELEETKDAYNDLFEQHRTLKHQIDEYDAYVDGENRKNLLEKMIANLADTQKEKIVRLVEKTSFANIEAFEAGVKLMIEEITKVEEKPASETVVEEKQEETTPVENLKQVDDRMKSYLSIM